VSSVIVSVTGSPDRVSALSGPGTRPGIRPVIRHGQRRASHHVPVSCCLSATGIRFSVTLFPPGTWAFLTVGLPGTTWRPDPDGVSTFHTCEIRPGWVPPLPRGRRCSSRPDAVPGRRLPLRSGQSLHPATASHQRGSAITGHQRGFTRFTRPVCPSPVVSRMGREALGLNPVLRTPPLPAAHDRAGPGCEHAPGTTRPT
jgi:hypothetical protein